MRVKQLGVIAFLGIISLLSGGNTSSSEMLYWNEDAKLNWADFAGAPDYNFADVSALTSSGIIHFKGCEYGKIIYEVYAYFDKSQSWVKEEARTEHHLQHEQIHFDITELYARRLRKELAKKDFKCGQEEEFERFIANYLVKWQMEQINYDLLTQHSMQHSFQKEWKYKIAVALSVFGDYHKEKEEEKNQ